jgi:hypothetical protein
MSSRTRKAAGGTGGRTSTGHQARTACGESGGHEALTLIEQVVRRENLVAAHARVVRNGGAPAAVSTARLRQLGLLSLLDEHQRLACAS